jgi:hypothetical protein
MRATAPASFRAARIRWWSAIATKIPSSLLREIAAKEIKPDEVQGGIYPQPAEAR